MMAVEDMASALPSTVADAGVWPSKNAIIANPEQKKGDAEFRDKGDLINIGYGDRRKLSYGFGQGSKGERTEDYAGGQKSEDRT